jgi:ABC-type polysaccharide/polyol phosphate transport system ATPase subunit
MIRLDQVHIRYPVHYAQRRTLREFFRLAGKRVDDGIDALQDISLKIESGDRVAVVGLNGAGKSTLLRVLAGILPPSQGSVVIEGRPSPLFELATGFEMDQSGWENIRIRGILLGLSRKEIDDIKLEVAEFAGLGKFIDLPLQTYSSGMLMRLAFAVSTAVRPDILLLDEVVGTGDLQFARKAQQRMREFANQGRILVFTSHNLGLARELCTRGLWLEHGRIVMDGPVDETLSAYERTAGP